MASITSTATRTLLVWVAIAILSGCAAIVAWRWTVATADGVTHTLLVQQELAKWMSAAQDLETGQRGYLLTKDPSYLTPYSNAREAIGKIHSELTNLVADNPAQMAVVEEIDKTLQERLAVIDKSLAEVAAGRDDAKGQLAEGGLGKTLMDRLRGEIGSARDQEKRLFDKRIGQFRDQSFWLLIAVLTTLLACAGLAMIALIRERERVGALEITALTLASSNRSLEARVAARTEELAIERDRAEAERERAEALLRDVTHRIGNTLALVVGFINLHIRHTSDPLSLKTLTGARDRIHAIASAQRRINVGNDLELVRIDTLIQAVMADVVAATSEDRITLSVDVPPLLAPAQVATSLCVLTQEFVVNSLKHAFGEEDVGSIGVRLLRDGDAGAELVIEDDGAGFDEALALEEPAPGGEGLGTKIATLLARQFGGSIAYAVARPGELRPGTRVTVRLTDLALTPSAPDEEAATPSRASA
jgi:two-component sensor histidine kinase/CHASE3 domain sensor protein